MRRQVLPYYSLLCRTLLTAVAVALASSTACSEVGTVAPDDSTMNDSQVTPTVCRHCESRHSDCELTCCPRKVEETEKKSVWKVTCEYVCIPGFRFPWECKKDRCGRECLVCGTVRAVNVLEKVESECETCGYQWEVKCVRRSGQERPADCQCPRCAERARNVAQGEKVRK